MSASNESESKSLTTAGVIVACGKLVGMLMSSMRVVLLAFFLAPSQIGQFALASSVLVLIDVFTETGIRSAVIQKRESFEECLSTVFVSQLARGLILCVLVCGVAVFSQVHFKSPTMAILFAGLSVVPAIRGFENPGLIRLQRNLAFGKITALQLTSNLIDTAFTLLLAWQSGSVLALVGGSIARVLFTTVSSFLVTHRWKQFSPSFAQYKSLYSFGIWILVSAVVSFLLMKGVDFVIATFIGLDALGVFQVACSVAVMPLVQFGQMISGVVYPALCSRQADPRSFQLLALQLLVASAVVGAACWLACLFVGPLVVKSLLPKSYHGGAEILVYVSMWAGTRLLGTANTVILNASGLPSRSAGAQVVMAVFLAIIIVPSTICYSIYGAVGSLITVGIFGQAIRYYFVSQAINESTLKVCLITVCPWLASAVAGFCLYQIVVAFGGDRNPVASIAGLMLACSLCAMAALATDRIAGLRITHIARAKLF